MGRRSGEDHDGLPRVLTTASGQPRGEVLGGGRGLGLVIDRHCCGCDTNWNSGGGLERDAIGYLGDIQTMRFQTK